MSKAALPAGGGPCSFEEDILTRLAAVGQVVGRSQNGFFLDIGEPDSLQAAQTLAPRSLARPVVFFDRDGVLNQDQGYAHQAERFDWIEGAVQAVKAVKDRNWLVFIVTNQSGAAQGFYEEAAVTDLHRKLQAVLRSYGAHFDDVRYSPHPPEGVVPAYARKCNWRKPGAGMITDLLATWPVDKGASIMMGDKSSDIQAARAAGLRAVQFGGGHLNRWMRTILAK